MPQFDAFGVVEGLECKLKPYADFDGPVPEPSDRQIAEFLKGLKTLMSSALKTGLHADLCSGQPSKEQILTVPMRRRQMFYQWLQAEVMSPEAATPGGNGQVLSLPRAAGA